MTEDLPEPENPSEPSTVLSDAAFQRLQEFKLNLVALILRHLKPLLVNLTPDEDGVISVRSEDIDTAIRNGFACPACRLDLFRPRPAKLTFFQRLRHLFQS